MVRPADVPAGDLPLPVERQDEEGGGGHGEGQVEQGPPPDAAVHQLITMGAFTHGIRVRRGHWLKSDKNKDGRMICQLEGCHQVR